MKAKVKEAFAGLPTGTDVLSVSQLMENLGRHNLPAIEQALSELIQEGFISVAALPGSPMSEIDPNCADPLRPTRDVYFRKRF